MKTIIKLGLMATLGFTACNNNVETKTSETATKQTDSTQSTVSNNATGGGTLDAVIAAYLKIKNGLADDNGQGAAAGGNEFVDALGKVDKSALTADQKKTFEETTDDAKEMAEHIGKNAGNIEHQREHFEMLSNDLYDLVKNVKPGQTLYKDFCPMYNNNEGANWISETKDIKNPYLGKKMPTCGEVKEEIK